MIQDCSVILEAAVKRSRSILWPWKYQISVKAIQERPVALEPAVEAIQELAVVLEAAVEQIQEGSVSQEQLKRSRSVLRSQKQPWQHPEALQGLLQRPRQLYRGRISGSCSDL